MSTEKKSTGSRRKGAAKKKKESVEVEVKAEEEKGEGLIVTGAEPTTETQSPSARAEITEAFSPSSETKSWLSSLLQLKDKAKSIIQNRVQMVTGMYSLFQGMRQSYGGDTKKVLSVVFSFAKEEAKRRINEAKSKLRKKIIGELD